MNYLKPIIIIALFCIVSSMAFSVTESGAHAFPEQLGESIFEMIKANQIDKRKTYLPKKEEWVTERKKFQYSKNLDESVIKLSEEVQFGLSNIRDRAIKNGINWNQTKITRILVKMEHWRSFFESNLKVYFSHAGSEYYFSLPTCVKIKRGWVLKEGWDRRRKIDWVLKSKEKPSYYLSDGPYVTKENQLDKFSEAFLKLLRENNEKELSRFCITENEMIAIMKHYQKNGVTTKKEFAMGKQIKRYQEQVKAGYNYLLKSATEVGLDWKTAKVDYITYKMFIRRNTHEAAIKLYVSDNKSSHIIKISRCMKLKRGWVLLSKRMGFVKK